jgi:membrane fusion protein (multidrug efflux system)
MSKTQRSFITLAVILFLGSVIGFNLFKNHMMAQFFATRPPPTFPVTVQKIEPMTWKPILSAFGFIEPYQGVTLATEAGGTVKNIAFESGQSVVKGQVLLSLDSTVEEAKLEAQEALLPARERQMKRALKLFADNSISENQKDDAVAEYFSLKSEVEALRATIFRRQLAAPFSGVVGLRNVYLGEYLNAGHEIVQLEDISTMRIRFSIAQTDLSRIHVDQALEIQVDAYPEEAFNGKITAIEPAVNSQSGVVEVQADIPNDRQILRSGMFARISVLLPEVTQQTIIVQNAIQFNLYGETLFIIDEEATKALHAQEQNKEDPSNIAVVKQVSVKVKERAGNLAWIESGLKLSDRIITSGQVRLSNGSQVRFVETDSLAPMASIPAL